MEDYQLAYDALDAQMNFNMKGISGNVVILMPSDELDTKASYHSEDLILMDRGTVKILAGIDACVAFGMLLSFLDSPFVLDTTFPHCIYVGSILIATIPTLGYVGASFLLRWPTWLYIIFMMMKAALLILLMVHYPPSFILFLCASVQLWLLSIAYTFVKAFSTLTDDRRRAIAQM